MFEVYGDRQTMRYWDTLPDTELDQTERRIFGMMQQKRPSYFIIEHKARAIGSAGIHAGDEIGFILHRAYWRQGLMRETLTDLIPWCSDALALPQITADTDPRNEASIALLTSLGFVETGRAERTILVGEEWCDSVFFCLSREAL